MYVVLLHYTAPPAEEVSTLLADQADWVDEHYRSGDFIASGGRTSPGGDVIIAAGALQREELDEVLATSPLVINGLARSEIIQFQALLTIPQLCTYADRSHTAAT